MAAAAAAVAAVGRCRHMCRCCCGRRAGCSAISCSAAMPDAAWESKVLQGARGPGMLLKGPAVGGLCLPGWRARRRPSLEPSCSHLARVRGQQTAAAGETPKVMAGPKREWVLGRVLGLSLIRAGSKLNSETPAAHHPRPESDMGSSWAAGEIEGSATPSRLVSTALQSWIAATHCVLFPMGRGPWSGAWPPRSLRGENLFWTCCWGCS